jgi:hypothetical protein
VTASKEAINMVGQKKSFGCKMPGIKPKLMFDVSIITPDILLADSIVLWF